MIHQKTDDDRRKTTNSSSKIHNEIIRRRADFCWIQTTNHCAISTIHAIDKVADYHSGYYQTPLAMG